MRPVQVPVDGTAGVSSVQSVAKMQSEDPAFYTWVTSLGAPLPITLTFFRVKGATEEGITLEWETSTELNFDHFNVQRSFNGKDFQTISIVKGHGTTKESHEYLFTDKRALSGTSYYRLQSIDFDGHTETFNVVFALFETDKNVFLYPIPVTESKLFFRLNFEPEYNVLISIISMTGIEVKKALIDAGETDAEVPLLLEPGMYLVRMSSIDYNNVQRIVIK